MNRPAPNLLGSTERHNNRKTDFSPQTGIEGFLNEARLKKSPPNPYICAFTEAQNVGNYQKSST